MMGSMRRLSLAVAVLGLMHPPVFADLTQATGIKDAGQLVGYYLD
jgi:hypothetical protein